MSIYHESTRHNQDCAAAIDAAISASNYALYHYDLKSAAQSVIDDHGPERVQWVLACNIAVREWDGRFSRNNVDWAKGFDIPVKEGNRFYCTTHPAILDGFISDARRIIQEIEKSPPAREKVSDILSEIAEHRRGKSRHPAKPPSPKRPERQ